MARYASASELPLLAHIRLWLGPCGPGTTFGTFLIWLGFASILGGACMRIGAILEAAFGRSNKG